MSNELQVVQPTALQIMQKVEIDTAIATAKQYPRDLNYFKDMSLAMATFDDETALECIYRRPVGKKKVGNQWVEEYAEGMSIRTAEIVVACYGNLKVQSRIIEQDEYRVVCQGVAHDLQTNNLISIESVKNTTKSDGTPFSESMRNVAAKACLAIAYRDAVFKVVPKAMCKHIEKAVKKQLFGNAESLEKRKIKLTEWIKKLGIKEERVWNALEITGIESITPKKLEILAGLHTGVKSGDLTIDEAFPEIKMSISEELNAE